MSKRANRSLALIHYSWNKLRHGLARSLFKPVFFVEKFMLCVCQPCSCRLVVSQSEIYFGNRFCCTFPVFTHSTNRRTSTSFLNVLITATWAPSKMGRKISVTLKSIICLYFEKTNSFRHTLYPNQAVVTSDQFWWKHQHSRWGFTHWCCSRFIWNLLFTIFSTFLTNSRIDGSRHRHFSLLSSSQRSRLLVFGFSACRRRKFHLALALLNPFAKSFRTTKRNCIY